MDSQWIRVNNQVSRGEEQELDVFPICICLWRESAKGYQMIGRKREEESLQADGGASDGSNLAGDEEQPPPLIQDLRHQINRGSWHRISEMMGEKSRVFCCLDLGIAA
jgi:hypothetical protein